MTWVKEFEPRDRRAAARAAAVLALVAALVTLMSAMLDPSLPLGWQLAAVLTVPTATLPLAALLYRRGHRAPRVTWLLIPVFGVVAVAGLDLVTRDASAAGQVFLAFPVLFAASQLRRRAVFAVVLLTVAADAVVALVTLPMDRALTDVAYVGATLVVMALLLVQAGEAQDRLVTRLTTLAAVDALTGLATRRVLDRAAHDALESASEGAGTALIVLDLDWFKTINDHRGHPVGDDALVHVASLLRGGVPPDAVVCRLGGDEMAVLLAGRPEAASLALAGELAALIRSRPLVIEDAEVALSVSIGVAFAPRDASTLRELYTAADAALYRAKSEGRDRVASAGTTTTG